MRFLVTLGLLVVNLLVYTRSALGATCTISKYDKDEINSALRDCSDLILNGINVPAGVTLNLNLKQGTKLTFQGILTWAFYEWDGPLLNITGTDVEIVGAPGHTLDAKGPLWWDGLGGGGGKTKPIFFVLHGMKNSVLRDITVKNTPNHAIWIEDSNGVVAQDVYVDNKDGDTQGGHNTDGFNVWKSNNVTLKRITVYNQDDCIAIKSGTNIFINDTFCSGGHGLSIGSVGGRDYNIVGNVFVNNTEIVNSANGIRIKTVYGATGSVTNVTYQNIVIKDITNYGIDIEGDYNITTGGSTGVATGGVPIRDFFLNNVSGTVKKSGANIYVLVKNASNWQWTNVNITGGKKKVACDGIPDGSAISC